jgi:hypothetical protein
MSVTTGEDRVEITNLATDIDGLVGEDTLILDYTGRYDGKAVVLLEQTWSKPVFASRMMLRISGNPSVLEDVVFIRNVEAVDITCPDDVGLCAFGGAGDDTIRGGLMDDTIATGGSSPGRRPRRLELHPPGWPRRRGYCRCPRPQRPHLRRSVAGRA